MTPIANVPHALVRAASRLVSTPVLKDISKVERVETSLDTTRNRLVRALRHTSKTLLPYCTSFRAATVGSGP